MHTPLSSYCVASGNDPPLRDMPPGPVVERDLDRWGSEQPTNWNVAYCDGSVHTMSYDIELEVHRRLANREDGLTVDDAL
jgi:hypothetical protein